MDYGLKKCHNPSWERAARTRLLSQSRECWTCWEQEVYLGVYPVFISPCSPERSLLFYWGRTQERRECDFSNPNISGQSSGSELRLLAGTRVQGKEKQRALTSNHLMETSPFRHLLGSPGAQTPQQRGQSLGFGAGRVPFPPSSFLLLLNVPFILLEDSSCWCSGGYFVPPSWMGALAGADNSGGRILPLQVRQRFPALPSFPPGAHTWSFPHLQGFSARWPRVEEPAGLVLDLFASPAARS